MHEKIPQKSDYAGRRLIVALELKCHQMLRKFHQKLMARLLLLLLAMLHHARP